MKQGDHSSLKSLKTLRKENLLINPEIALKMLKT